MTIQTIQDSAMNFFNSRGVGRPPVGGYNISTINEHISADLLIWEEPTLRRPSLRAALGALVRQGRLRRVSAGHYTKV